MEVTMNKIRNLIIASLLVVLVLPTSLAFAAGSEGFSGDDLYDSAADLSGAEVNYVTNFPCEEAGADQLGSGAFSSEEAFVGMDPDDVVACDWPQLFGNGPLENLKDPDDVVAYDWPQFFGNRTLENLKDPDDVVAYRMAWFYEKNTQLNNQMDPEDVVAYDWPQLFGNGPLENLNDYDDVVTYDWPQFYGNRPLNTK
jgi:hypothetical protein